MWVALVLVPIASLIWAATNNIDKYLVSRVAKKGDFRGLIVMSSLVAGVALLPVSWMMTGGSVAIEASSLLLVFGSAGFYVVGTVFYFLALRKNDTSIVVAMTQLIPVFGYFLGLVFLDEFLTVQQVLGALVVIGASTAMTFEFRKGRFSKEKVKALLLMALSSLAYAVYFLLFRMTATASGFGATAFWYQIGLMLVGVSLLVSKSFRRSFVELIAMNGKKVVALNVVNEVLNLGAELIVNFAMMFAAMAIVQTLNGLQPVFAFLIAATLAVLYPKSFREDLGKRVVIQKVVCIAVSFMGLAILYL